MFKASKAALKSALALSGDIVERRNTIPILSNLLIERASKHELEVRMTDLDVEGRILFEADVEESFQPFTVPAGLLREIVGKLPDGAEISVKASGPDLHQVKVSAGRSTFSLQVLPATDFPDLTAGGFAASFPVPASAFAKAMGAVAFAISTEETRYYLNGIFLHAAEGGMMLVATDGHRLAKRFISAAPGAMPGIILPKKTVGILSKLLSDKSVKDAEVRVEASDQKVRFSLPGITITSKLIDGTFPDYQRVVPQSHTGTAELDGAILKAAVDRVAVISSERGRAARFRFEDGTLTLEVNNPDAGTAQETLAYDGDAAMETGFNAKYVLEAIGSLPDGPLLMEVTDAGSPAILRVDGDHKENVVVLMPMRV